MDPCPVSARSEAGFFHLNQAMAGLPWCSFAADPVCIRMPQAGPSIFEAEHGPNIAARRHSNLQQEQRLAG